MALHAKHISFIEKCYELYEQKMFRVALSVLHDESLAEDAVQDAFLQLIRHEVHFKDAGSDDCKRYMITVIRNASINIYNKKKNEIPVADALDTKSFSSVTDGSIEISSIAMVWDSTGGTEIKGETLLPETTLKITYKDGSEYLVFDENNRNIGYVCGTDTGFIVLFNRLVDIDNIAVITIDGVEFTVNG